MFGARSRCKTFYASDIIDPTFFMNVSDQLLNLNILNFNSIDLIKIKINKKRYIVGNIDKVRNYLSDYLYSEYEINNRSKGQYLSLYFLQGFPESDFHEIDILVCIYRANLDGSTSYGLSIARVSEHVFVIDTYGSPFSKT